MLILGVSACIGTQAPANVIDGYAVSARVGNGDPASTLTITPGTIGSNPATITIDDQYSGPFEGSNRHDVLASDDGGATASIHDIDASFRFETTLTLTGGQNSPRKEAGIRINSPITGDMLFIVNSDAGEIVTFGGGGPFYLFGNNAGGNGYTMGTTITMGIEYLGAGDGAGGTANTVEFFIDYGAGVQTSGPLAWDNAELGAVNFQVGVYAQGGANAADDFINAEFTDTTYTVIPEPGTLTMLAMGLLGALARRRIGGR